MKYFSDIFLENRIWHFMQIVSYGDNLHEVSDPIFKEDIKNVINLSSAESAHSVVSVNTGTTALLFILVRKHKENHFATS